MLREIREVHNAVAGFPSDNWLIFPIWSAQKGNNLNKGVD